MGRLCLYVIAIFFVNSALSQDDGQDVRIVSGFLKELNNSGVSEVYLVPQLNGDFHGEDPVLGKAPPKLLVNMIGYFLDDDAKTFTNKMVNGKKEIGYWDTSCDYVVLFKTNKRNLSFQLECNVLKERVLFRIRTDKNEEADIIYEHAFSEWIISRLVKVKSSSQGSDPMQ